MFWASRWQKKAFQTSDAPFRPADYSLLMGESNKMNAWQTYFSHGPFLFFNKVKTFFKEPFIIFYWTCTRFLYNKWNLQLQSCFLSSRRGNMLRVKCSTPLWQSGGRLVGREERITTTLPVNATNVCYVARRKNVPAMFWIAKGAAWVGRFDLKSGSRSSLSQTSWIVTLSFSPTFLLWQPNLQFTAI